MVRGAQRVLRDEVLAERLQIRAVDLWRVDLELVSPVETATSSHQLRPLSVVRVATDDGEGYGECDALIDTTYFPDDADHAETQLCDVAIPALLSHDRDVSIAEILRGLDLIPSAPMARSCIEMAVLDLALSRNSRSMSEFVGASVPLVPASATIGIAGLDQTLDAARDAVSSGYRRVKLKIAPQSALEVLGTIRAELPELALVADANGTYALDDPNEFASLIAIDELGIDALEQPGRREDLAGHTRLAEALSTPIFLDESVAFKTARRDVLEAHRVAGIVVKASVIGGIVSSLQEIEAFAAAGFAISIGGMFESGIGRAAGLALAARLDVSMSDLGASDRYFTPDLTDPHVLCGGNIAVPTGSGLGVRVDRQLLDQLAIRRASFRP